MVDVLLVGAVQHEPGQELVEHDPVRDAGPMTAQRMSDLAARDQRVEPPHRGSVMEEGRTGT
ncbi:hypothetical protein GCM10017779_62390 [Streptomyces capillispiralis]|nr:hypothetical protein GCM10017779_62390 [Streptomyces capillispiralis]